MSPVSLAGDTSERLLSSWGTSVPTNTMKLLEISLVVPLAKIDEGGHIVAGHVPASGSVFVQELEYEAIFSATLAPKWGADSV